MNHRELIQQLSPRYGEGEARAVVRLLLEQAFGLTWTDVLCGALDRLPAESQLLLAEAMARLEQGEPVQHVVGRAEFCGREFEVSPSVLIPRPETECLVAEASHYIKERCNGARVLDIGTGSGCIALTLALDNPDCSVQAWDISDEALAVARRNAQRLNAGNVEFSKVDVLSREKEILYSGEPFDVIVSNPPYICQSERKDMESIVLDHEPALALFVADDDPLLFYREITNYAKTTVSSGGLLIFEINREYGKEVAELMKNNGFIEVFVQKDQFGNDRIVKGIKA